MLLGKRARPPIMKRTASMTEITFDVSPSSDEEMVAAGSQPSDPHNPFSPSQYQYQYQACLDQRYSGMVSSRTSHRRNSADFVIDSSTHFLRSCGLCKRRLVPTRDIYMYRGDTAFCSLECRQQQMNQDERLEKCSLASKKEVVTSSASAARSQVAAKGETVAAV